MTHLVRIGTRGSKLALWQTNHVAQLLREAAAVECQIEILTTQGDRKLDQPLPEIGGKGLFTAELEEALHRNQIDIAVHSLKDLPVEDAPGLVLGAIVSRADVRDALVARNGWTLATLPHGAVVGTSSLRRQSQLLAIRPDLTIRSIRGNVDTRVRKVMSGDYDAALFAGAGLTRLGMDDVISEWLPLDVMLPAPGQGALAVQCRADDATTLALLAQIDDWRVRSAVWIERQFLQGMGGGCSAPIGAYAVVTGSNKKDSHSIASAVIGSLDGKQSVRVTAEGADPKLVAEALIEKARASGADQLLSTLRSQPAQPQPLQNRRIVVTRTTEQAGDFRAKLKAAGATVVEIPAIRIVPVDDWQPLDSAIASLATYQWLLFTSTNAVELFWQRFKAHSTSESLPATLKIGAVGSATREMLRTYGVEPDVMPDSYNGEDLARSLPNVAGQRILLPRAADARRAIIEILTSRGAVVDEIILYHTQAAPLASDALAALQEGVDAITFTSGSTARHFVAALDAQGMRAVLERSLIACIGPITADAVRSLGLTPGVVATEQTTTGLLNALISHFRKESP